LSEALVIFFLSRWWRNISICKKLYTVVGVMAFLVAIELFVLSFAMETLSASRAFVAGEGIWSKAQKDALISLMRFGVTKDDRDYQEFQQHLRIQEGDRKARLEFFKDNPDEEVIRTGFLQGGIHTDDIDPMLKLLKRFHNQEHMRAAVVAWTQADTLIEELRLSAKKFRQSVLAGNIAANRRSYDEIRVINARLTELENAFSHALGEGSRFLETLVLSCLLFVVFAVEGVGLTLAFLTSRNLSYGLDQLTKSATLIGLGNFDEVVPVESEDEIGKLSRSLNRMKDLLQKFYADLESRVHERTKELSMLARENKALYEQASSAAQYREEFLCVASHELKTPLTALQLQLQLLAKRTKDKGSETEIAKMSNMLELALRQLKRLNVLVGELFDLTQLRVGKLELKKQHCSLSGLIRDVVTQMQSEAQSKGIELRAQTPVEFFSTCDPVRIGQVLSNLISNAIKYGQEKPVDVSLSEEGNFAVIRVRDYGHGIESEERQRIFDRYSRANKDPNVTGLGLGLYIAKHIVDEHGGLIDVLSEVGQGSTFVVKLRKAKLAEQSQMLSL
jgi:signal transduction histidine kinase